MNPRPNYTLLLRPGLTGLALATALIVPQAQAAPVIFENSSVIADTSNLDAPQAFPGATLLQAGNFGSGDQTVSTVGGQTINFTGLSIAFNAAPSGTSTALFRAGSENNAALFSGDTGDAGLNSVLQGQGWAASGNSTLPETLRIGDLTEGTIYVVHLLASDMRAGSAGRTQRYNDTEDYSGNQSDSFSVQSPTSVLGWFTADSSGYQDIFIEDTRDTGWDTTLAGFTLYSATAVPEPTTGALVLAGAGLLLVLSRRKA